MIDLTKTGWYARQDFNEQDAAGFSPSDAGVRQVASFPILLNDIFHVPAGDELNQFTLMTRFELSSSQVQQPLMISLAEAGENWSIYLNGVEIRREIFLDANGQIGLRRSLQKVLIAMPPNILHQGENILVAHMLGYAPATSIFHGAMPGFPMSSGYWLGPAEEMVRHRSSQAAASWFQIGTYLFFGLYQFLLYYRNKTSYSLLFGLFLLLFGAYALVNSTLVFDHILDTSWITRVMYGVAIAAGPLIGLSLWDFLYTHKPVSFGLQLINWLCLVGIMAVFVLPMPWVEAVMKAFLPILLVNMLYLCFLVIRAARLKVADANKFIFSGVLIVAVVIWSVVDVVFLRTGLDLAAWAPFLLAMAFAIVYVDRFWKLAIDLGESNRQLAFSRSRLEEQVEARTAELVGANTLLEVRLVEINKLQDSLKEQTIRDPLTGLFNRRYLNEKMSLEFERARQDGHSLCVVMMDIDHFKGFNDTYGHQAGDDVLVKLGSLLLSETRRDDIVCRYGGEEFLVLMPDATLEGALHRTEKWRSEVAGIVLISTSKEVHITISAGVAQYPTHGSTPDEVLREADNALYKAKHNGRNRVETAGV